MTSPLSPEDIHQLMVVRSMLEGATLFATQSTALQRTQVVVFLDGVVERVTHLVAVTRGVEVKRNDGLDDLTSKIRADLGSDWKPRGLVEVRQLHRARNSAQHEGLSPDRDDVPKWARGVRSYVQGLVDAQYDVDIERIVLTDAVGDGTLRSQLETAATHMADGAFGECVAWCGDVVEAARLRWAMLHAPGSAGRAPNEWRQSFKGIGKRRPVGDSGEYAYHEVEKVNALIRLTTFAPSMAEATWFLRVINEAPVALTADDAERALAFAVNWVVGFESAEASWVPDRVERHWRQVRLVRTEESAPARIVEVIGVAPDDRVTARSLLTVPDIKLTVRLGDVPGDAMFDEWRRRGNVNLSVTKEGVRRWLLDGDGTASVVLGPDHDVADAMDQLEQALLDMELAFTKRRRSILEQAGRVNETEAQFAEAIRSWGARPEWLIDAHLDLAEQRIIIDLTQEAVGMMHGAESAARLFRDSGRVGWCTPSGPRSLSITPPISSDTLKLIALHSRRWFAREHQSTADRQSVEQAIASIRNRAVEHLESPERTGSNAQDGP